MPRPQVGARRSYRVIGCVFQIRSYSVIGCVFKCQVLCFKAISGFAQVLSLADSTHGRVGTLKRVGSAAVVDYVGVVDDNDVVVVVVECGILICLCPSPLHVVNAFGVSLSVLSRLALHCIGSLQGFPDIRCEQTSPDSQATAVLYDLEGEMLSILVEDVFLPCLDI